MHIPDEELVAKAKAGDKQAFTELWDRYSGKILGYLYRYVGDYQKAEDLTIETFLSAYNHLSDYDEMGKFSSWLYRIATNCAKMEIRASKHDADVALDKPLDEGSEETLKDLIADERERPDYSAREKELKEFVYKVMSKLDKKYRDTLLLCDVEGLSREEAARVLKTNRITVETRLRRARKMLYGVLKSEYGYGF